MRVVLTSEDWKNVLESMIERRTEGSLAKICDEVGWPVRDQVLGVLTSDYFERKNIKKIRPPTDVPQASQKTPSAKNRLAFWSNMVDMYQLTLADMEGKKFPFWLMEEKLSDCLCKIIQASKPEDIQKWCFQPSDVKMMSSSSSQQRYNLNVLEALVQSNDMPILREIFEWAPFLAKSIGAHHRSLLFYAQSPEAVELLLKNSAPYQHQDQHHQKTQEYWTNAQLPQLNEMMQVVSRMGVDNVTSVLVNKIASFVPSLNDEEKHELQNALEHLDTWTWNGTLHGMERTWTLPEIWRMSELMLCLDRGASLGVKYPHGEASMVYQPKCVVDRLKKAHALFPDISHAVQAHPPTMFVKVVDFLVGLSSEKSESGLLFNPSSSLNAYSTRNIDMVLEAMKVHGERLLSSVPPASRDDFNQIMLLMMEQPWFQTASSLAVKKDAYINRWLLPLSKGGFATPCLTQAMASSPRHKNLRAPWALYHYQRALSIRKHQSKKKTSFLPKDDPLESSWSDVVYLALGFCASSPLNLLSDFQKELALELSRPSLQLPHIPVRWSKLYGAELESAVVALELKQKLSKKMEKKSTQTPSVKRKM